MKVEGKVESKGGVPDRSTYITTALNRKSSGDQNKRESVSA